MNPEFIVQISDRFYFNFSYEYALGLALTFIAIDTYYDAQLEKQS